MEYNDTFNFLSAFKVLSLEGNLVYEYNPFYNYRLDRDMIYYKNRLWDKQEFADELGIKYDPNSNIFYIDNINTPITDWSEVVPAYETTPIVYLKGLLVDFETDELNFDLSHPVNVLPLYSYDNSVNLILNDGINPPRLINSRFSATEKNKYLICNRKGNNDSNIYDLGDLFDVDTSLYKKISNIPVLQFLGIGYGGNLGIGNYHFYFRYVDEDENFSDFFAESGLVSIFIGNTADSSYLGFRDENSHKLVKFSLSNVDPGYTKVVIYYTKATADIYQNALVNAYKIDRKFVLSESGNTIITVTGYEEVEEVPVTEINPMYLIYGSAETLAAALNMLFLGNVDRPKLEYEDLADCALRFLPYIDTSKEYNISLIKSDYSGDVSNTYYDSNFIYNFVGYHSDEIYRFGIVFILSDNTLSEVYNVRGAFNIGSDYNSYTKVDFYEPGTTERKFINFDELYYSIINENLEASSIALENAKGVLYTGNQNFNSIIGIRFAVSTKVINYLIDTLKIKGFFFVRQKRIPTTLCLAYTIGIDKESKTPVIPYDNAYIAESFLTKYQTKSGSSNEADNSRILDNDVKDRKYNLNSYEVRNLGAICPEYDVNAPYLNTLFTGTEFVCKKIQSLELQEEDNIHYICRIPNSHSDESGLIVKIIGVEDNMKLCAIGDNEFSARAGEAEEAYRYEYIGKENKITKASNFLRGSFGPYLGIVGYNIAGDLIDIKIPGYSEANMLDYFKIRYHDKSPFYAISYRFDLSKIDRWASKQDSEYILDSPLYRGDCYICLFTHRINRNFQDPSSPTNDKIVDPKCWRDHYKVEDGVVKTENFDDINLGDVNAVKLGLYITLFIRSTYNLNVRALDTSNVDEESLFGHPRGFYPYFPLSNSGSYKIPEALCYNKGFEKSVSEKLNFEVPDVPWIKNEFSNRICYSDIQVKDAFSNGWRTFRGLNYRDYPKTYGSITKLVEFRGNLVCVFEHGVALIPVNERTVAGIGNGGNAYINTSNVLPENPRVLSDMFGSLWRESIIKTPRAIYGVDTIGKKIWRTDGIVFECISDFKIQEFLNNNISLTERELNPVIGIRNVKAHYNKYKYDVMFTFYDNLEGFEEKAWNLCYNELMSKWITFYSWIPSYSENINNIYFSFDRNTSKWIAKLGISDSRNNFSDGVTLSNNIIPNDALVGDTIGLLSLSNRNLPTGNGIQTLIYYTLERDCLQNWRNFKIVYRTYQLQDGEKVYGEEITLDDIKQGVSLLFDSFLCLNSDIQNLLSELYVRDDGNGNKVYPTKPLNLLLLVYKDKRGRRLWLDKDLLVNSTNIVTLLNIKAHINIKQVGGNPEINDYLLGWNNNTAIEAGYYESIVAVTPQYNLQFLTTDFWKHGLSGIFDITDKILPGYWYGKQHPFEFEVIVADNPSTHKLFDNLSIIGNKAVPESFHYEIVGESFTFSTDKKNMFVRLEVTKDFYQYNGSDITYNKDLFEIEPQQNKRSTTLPLYYSRVDNYNDVEDYYKQMTSPNKDYNHLSGSEIVYYKNADEYRIWEHSKAVDIGESLLKGNMNYLEDRWNIQINPIVIVEKNENQWNTLNEFGETVAPKVPITIGNSPIPEDFIGDKITLDNIPLNLRDNLGYTLKDVDISNWGVYAIGRDSEGNILYADADSRREVKVKDKFIKIRIRYSGKELAVITALKTLYSISYA